MGGSTHGCADRRTDAPVVNRPPTSGSIAPAHIGDGGRTIFEAVVALALIAIAVTSWGRMSVTAARTETTVAHREVALELANNTLEELRLRSWETAAIDPASLDAVRRFEGSATIFAAAGVPARVVDTRDGRDFAVVTHITNSGDDSWRRAIVIVEWHEGERATELRIDSALRRPDAGDGT